VSKNESPTRRGAKSAAGLATRARRVPSPGPARDEARSGPGLLLVLSLSFVLGFGFLGTRGLGEPDEGRYVGAALEMLASGQYLVPTLGDTPHLTKPPLTYWLSAAGMFVLGRNEWGARVFLGLVFAAHVLVVLGLGSSLGGRAFGRIAALMFATMLMPFVGASLVTTDALLALWESAAVACFVVHWHVAPTKPPAIWLVGMWGAFGLAFLTKGPPGLLPLVAIGSFAVWQSSPGGGVRSLARLAHPVGLVLFAALGLSWFTILAMTQPEAIEGLLRQEVWDRVLGGGHGRNTQWFKPLTMYLPTLALGSLPWSVAVPLLLWRRRRAANATRMTLDPAERRLAWLWLLVPFAVFCLARSRQLLYLLPLFTPLALLGADVVASWLDRRPVRGEGGWRRWMSATAIAWAGMLLALRLISAEVASPRDARQVAEFVRPHFDPAADVLVLATPRYFGLSLYLPGEIREAGTAEPAEMVGGAPSLGPDHDADSSVRRRLYLARRSQLGALADLFERPPPGCRLVTGPHDLLLAVCRTERGPGATPASARLGRGVSRLR